MHAFSKLLKPALAPTPPHLHSIKTAHHPTLARCTAKTIYSCSKSTSPSSTSQFRHHVAFQSPNSKSWAPLRPPLTFQPGGRRGHSAGRLRVLGGSRPRVRCRSARSNDVCSFFGSADCELPIFYHIAAVVGLDPITQEHFGLFHLDHSFSKLEEFNSIFNISNGCEI